MNGPPQPPSAAPSPARKWWFRMTALVVLPVLLLGGTEAALRLAGCGYPTGFFEKIRAGGKDFLVNNDSFSLRFFPPKLARQSSPFMMEAGKPADTCRIFVLGESAAEGNRSRLSPRHVILRPCCPSVIPRPVLRSSTWA